MLIELRNGVHIEPCTLTAIVGPEQVIIDMINDNPDLHRYLLLFVSGNFTRILNGVTRLSSNFEVRRAFTAHQVQTTLKEISHSVLILEHDPTLYDSARETIGPISGLLSQISHDTTVIVYSPSADRAYTGLTQKARHLIYYMDNEPFTTSPYVSPKKQQNQTPQKTLQTWSIAEP